MRHIIPAGVSLLVSLLASSLLATDRVRSNVPLRSDCGFGPACANGHDLAVEVKGVTATATELAIEVVMTNTAAQPIIAAVDDAQRSNDPRLWVSLDQARLTLHVRASPFSEGDWSEHTSLWCVRLEPGEKARLLYQLALPIRSRGQDSRSIGGPFLDVVAIREVLVEVQYRIETTGVGHQRVAHSTPFLLDRSHIGNVVHYSTF